jgi:hypothetical protein
MLFKNLKRLSFIIFILLSTLLQAQIFNKEVEAKIMVSPQDEMYTITGSALNKTDLNKSLSYRMSVVKNNQNLEASSKTDQAGLFVLEPNERKNLTSSTVNAEEDQRIIVFLLVYQDSLVVGKDRIVINGLEGEDSLKPMVIREGDGDKLVSEAEEEVDVVLLRGVVIEDTKTKPGRDFYKFFYNAYTANNINGEEIVKVQEVLAMGSNTQLKIFVGQDIVAQFFLNPRASFLKEKAEQSVYLVNKHLIGLKEAKKQKIRY